MSDKGVPNNELNINISNIDTTTKSNELLLKIFKEACRDGIVIIDDTNSILHINDLAKRLIGQSQIDNLENKILLPYSIVKEKVIKVKVSPYRYRAISINASKVTQGRKKYYLLTIKEIGNEEFKQNTTLNLLSNSDSYFAYSYDYQQHKFLWLNDNLKQLLKSQKLDIDFNAGIINYMHKDDQLQLAGLIENIENSEQSELIFSDSLNYRYILNNETYYVQDYTQIIKSNGKIIQIDSEAILIRHNHSTKNNKEQGQLLNLITNHFSLGLFKINLIERNLEVSPTLLRYLGYTQEEVEPLFENFKYLIHRDDVEEYFRLNAELLHNNGRFFERQFRIKNKAGNYVHIASKAAISSYDEIGNIAKIVGLFFDNEKLHQQTRNYIYYKELFEILINNTNDVVFITDSKGKLQHLSRTVEKLTEHKNKEFINRYIWDTVMMTMSKQELDSLEYEYHKSQVLDGIRNTLLNSKSESVQSKHHSNSGGEFHLETVMYALQNPDLDKAYLVAIAKDITSLVLMQKEIRAKESIHDELIDNASDAIIVFEPKNETIVFANREAGNLYGILKNDLIGRSMVDFSTNIDLGVQKINETVENEGVVRFTSIHKDKSGKKFTVKIIGSYINYKGQNVIMSINKFIKYIE
ncbi:MAG TPA: PAS domain S-box protein [Candidatus Kapabacteria bacterium]|nr:PAS domain S-box protein [Candidatus Kapabacteria bacterium]